MIGTSRKVSGCYMFCVHPSGQAGMYEEWEDYHADMMLVRDNCLRYNAPGTEVRRDCDEVFTFYLSEYDKIKTRWKQVKKPTIHMCFF